MQHLPLAEDTILCWTNRRIESTFAFLKAVNRRFDTMTSENVQMVSMAMQNHLSAWIMANGEEISSVSAKKAYLDLKERRAAQFTLETAVEEFQLLNFSNWVNPGFYEGPRQLSTIKTNCKKCLVAMWPLAVASLHEKHRAPLFEFSFQYFIDFW